MIDVIEKKYQLHKKNLIKFSDLKEDIERLDDSLLNVITLLGATKCASITGYVKSNFSDFLNRNDRHWTIDRKIKIYKKIWDWLNKS